MTMAAVDPFQTLSCSGSNECVKLEIDPSQSFFTVIAYKPNLTKADEGRYTTTLSLIDNNANSASSRVKVIVDIVYEEASHPSNAACFARIISIDEVGHTLIKFSRNMTNINQTSLELHVVPANQRNIYDDTYSNPDVNMTWFTKSFIGDELLLKVNFTYPLEISPESRQDKLLVHFKNQMYEANKTCSERGRYLGAFQSPESCREVAMGYPAEECSYFMHSSQTSEYFPQ